MAILGTLGAIFGSKAGTKAVEAIIDTVAKKIPMTQDEKAELEAELAKTEVDMLKAKTDHMHEMSKYIKDWILPAGVGIFFLMHVAVFLSDFVHAAILHQEAPIIPISNDLKEIVETIIMFLFGYKTAKKVIKK